MTWEEAFQILQDITGEQEYNGFAGFPEIRREKCKALFELAGEVPEGGIIIDLGTHRGLTSITMALGSKPSVTVHTVDDYNTRRVENVGSKDLTYSNEDYEMFRANVAKLPADVQTRIVHHFSEARELAAAWSEPVDLVFWDLWGERLLDDMQAWAKHLTPSGTLAAKVFEDGSCKEWRLYQNGWELEKYYPTGCVYTFQKQQAAPQGHAVWIVYGESYYKEAIRSAGSVQTHMPDLKKYIFGVTKRQHKEWYYDQTRTLIDFLERLPDGEKVLWLDSDTYMCEPVDDLFEMLDRFDMVLAHAPGHYTAPTVFQIPEAFPEFNIGVIAMKNAPRVRLMWQEMYQRQTEYASAYGDNDQAPLREVLWGYPNVITFATMPCEYNFRFNFGGQVRDRVKILHGHAPDAETYERIAASVNEGYEAGYEKAPRLWMMQNVSG